MRILVNAAVDRARYEGHRQCGGTSQSVYAPHDEGYVQVLEPGDLTAALAGARSCPVAALKVQR